VPITAAMETDASSASAETSWPLGLRVLATSFTLEGLGPQGHADLARDWSRCVRETADPYAVPVPLHDRGGEEPVDLGGTLAAELTRHAVERLTGQALMMHAAGLCDDQGRVLALVGHSGAGKSSAARALCTRSFGYVTDETVAVDELGRVLPYPKPLSLGRDPATGRKVQIGPDALGLRTCPSQLSLARIVLLERSSAGQHARLELVPLDEAVVALVPHTSSLTALDEPLQTLCRVIDACGGVFRLTYAEIEDAEDVLLALLADTSTTPADWQPERVTTEVDDMRWALRDGKVRQRPAQDAVQIGDDVLLMVDSVPVRLSGIGTTLWRASSAAATLDDLERATTEAHGAHPQARELVNAAVVELCDAGALGHHSPLIVADVLAGRANIG